MRNVRLVIMLGTAGSARAEAKFDERRVQYLLKTDTQIKMNYIIREIEAKDNKAVENIIRTCLIEFDGAREGTAWEDPDLCRFSEIYNTDEKKYWVAESTESGRLAGGVGIAPLCGIDGASGSGRVCELQKMYCIPGVRGSGISHKLIETALEHAKKYYDICYLETFGNMIAAQKFYEKYGFTRISKPMGNTGHYACDVMYIKYLKQILFT